MATDVSERLRRQVAERASHVCEYCLMHEDDTFWGCEVDHIISRKHQGETNEANLAFACAVCNSFKGSDIGTWVGQPAVLTRFFHPLTDRWLAHFSLNKALIATATP